MKDKIIEIIADRLRNGWKIHKSLHNPEKVAKSLADSIIDSPYSGGVSEVKECPECGDKFIILNVNTSLYECMECDHTWSQSHPTPESAKSAHTTISEGEILGRLRKECLELGTFPECEPSLPSLAKIIKELLNQKR